MSHLIWLLRRCLALSVLVALISTGYSQDATETGDEEELPDPYEWITESYSFPAGSLIWGFASEERGELRAPTMPDEGASDEEVQDFMRKSNSVVSHYLETEGFALPKGVLTLFDPESNTLTARAPRLVHGSLGFVSENFQQSTESYILLEGEILEAATENVHAIVSRAGETADHSELREELLEAEGTILIETGQVEMRSGNRAKIGGGEEVYHSDALILVDDGVVEYSNDSRGTGTEWEFDPVLGADDITIDLNLSLRYNITPPARRMIEFTREDGRTIAAAATEAHVASVISQYTMESGATKLLGTWNPVSVGKEAEENVRQIAFVRATAIRNLPVLEDRLTEMLKAHGEAILPIPEGDLEFEKEAEEIPEGMIVRRFVIPPTFLSAGGGGGSAADAADPFADPIRSEPRFTVQVTAKDILRSAGIGFPEGSSANYLPSSSVLVVRNTPENIQLVEAYVMSLSEGVERSIGTTVHLIEGPADLIREMAAETRGLTDHEAQLNELLDNDGVKLLETIWLEARSGQRAKVETGQDYVFPVGVVRSEETSKEEDEDPVPGASINEPVFDMRTVGTSFELDPVLGADGTTVDINFALGYDFAPPEHQAAPPVEDAGAIEMEGPTTRFFRSYLVTQTVYRSGSTRMMGYWPLKGAPENEGGEILQAAFMKIDVMKLQEEPE